MVKVKICGISSLEEAEWAVEAGADALGFVFAPSSKRYVEPKRVREITAQLPPFIARVGVFVDSSPAEVREIITSCGLTVIQLHGDENPEDYRELALPLLKAVRFELDGEEVAGGYLGNWIKSVQGIVLDAAYGGNFGGTGRALPWHDQELQGLCQEIARNKTPLILAGGLNPNNIQTAVAKVRPYAVDVSSGVESAGRKQRELIRAFVTQAKSC